MKPRFVTVVVHTDGEVRTRSYRLPLWAVRVGKAAALAVAALALLFFAFAGPITRAAARVPALEGEVSRLRSENARVKELAAALNRAEASYQELRSVLGAPTPGSDPTMRRSGDLPRTRVIAARPPGARTRYETGASIPSHWPLDERGFVTRGQIRPGSEAESHPGIDIAVPAGTPVRAAGGGEVTLTGVRDDYGVFVLLRHPDGYETMYGHASRVLVGDGDSVSAGQVIALSGNTGRSTAPHLHFEVRRGGRMLDPLSLLKEGT